MENGGQKCISWLGRGFYFVFNYSYVSWFADEAASPPSLLLPSCQCTQESAVWGRQLGVPWLLFYARMHLDKKDVETGVSNFGIPNSLQGSHSSHSSTAFAFLHQKPFFPSSPQSPWQGIPGWVLTNARGPFSWAAAEGNSARLCTGGPGRAREGTRSIVWI